MCPSGPGDRPWHRGLRLDPGAPSSGAHVWAGSHQGAPRRPGCCRGGNSEVGQSRPASYACLFPASDLGAVGGGGSWPVRSLWRSVSVGPTARFIQIPAAPLRWLSRGGFSVREGCGPSSPWSASLRVRQCMIRVHDCSLGNRLYLCEVLCLVEMNLGFILSDINTALLLLLTRFFFIVKLFICNSLYTNTMGF